jgi:hypothetical protein
MRELKQRSKKKKRKKTGKFFEKDSSIEEGNEVVKRGLK